MGEGQASWSETAPSAALTEQETAGEQDEASSALPAEEPARPAPEPPAPEPPAPEPSAQPEEPLPPETAQPTPPQDPIPETGEIPLDAAHFPDPAFQAFLTAYDADGSESFSEEERMGITRLDLRNKGIASLEGIGAFPSLTCLHCIGNSLKTLPMEQLTGLTSLLCNENALTELDLSQTPGLKVLHCHDNLITSLDLSHLPVLWELACGDNPFTSLGLSHNPELAWFLYMGGPLEPLTLSGNEGLIDLWCAYSRVSPLDLSQAPNLELLGMENSRFTYLDLSANPKLTQVLAARNLLLAVEMGSAAPQMDLSDQQPLEIQMGEGQTSFDLASLGLPIDPACLSQPEGARLNGTLLEDIPPEGTVRYRYTQGAASFTASLRFHVSNGWLEPLTLEDWTYGQPAHTPHSDAQFGEPVYTLTDANGNSYPLSGAEPVRAIATGSIWMGGPAPENDPVMEVEIYCEGTGFGEDTGPIQAQETARCSYRPAQEEYSTFTAGGEVLGQSWVVDLVYLLADPKFLDEAGNKSYSWSGSCSWTDENGQTQTQELSIL